MTTVKRCDCKSTFQDGKYGLGMRVMNILQKAGKLLSSARCTVCGTVHQK